MATIRITGGEWNGRGVHVPATSAVRPTLARVRQSLFGILREEIQDAAVIDCFAGSGVLGFESLSRGAERVSFIERNPKCLAAITESIRSFGAEESCHVIRGDVLHALRAHGEALRGADIAFIDPPYGTVPLRKVVDALGEIGVATLVIEHERREDIQLEGSSYAEARRVDFGQTVLSILRTDRGKA